MNNPQSDTILKTAIQTANDGKYARPNSDWKTYSSSTIVEKVIADHNDSLQRHAQSNSHADFTDGTDAKTGTMSVKKTNKGYALTVGISGCDKKFGYIRGLFTDNISGEAHALVIDKYYLQNNKEKLSFSLKKFGEYFKFSIEEMIERDVEWFDNEFAKRRKENGRPEWSPKKRKAGAPEVTVESIMNDAKEAYFDKVIKGISETSTLSEDEIRILLKKVA